MGGKPTASTKPDGRIKGNKASSGKSGNAPNSKTGQAGDPKKKK